MFTDKTAFHHVIRTDNTVEWYDKIASFKVNIQPASAETTVLVGGIYGKTFTTFTTYSGLQINDMVTVSGSTTVSGYTYKVKGILGYDYSPLKHYEVTLVWPES